jgi:nucleotide-binding universal stress UspA family protein
VTGDAGAPRRVRRLLVALDASEPSRAALDAAIDLASRLGSDLLGLFIEDEALIRIGGIPIARVVGLGSAAGRAVDVSDMERELRAVSSRARRMLAEAAAAARVPWSFRAVRGRVTEELLAAAAEADLICLARVGGTRARDHSLGSTARAVVTRATGTVLLVPPGRRVERPIRVVYDGSRAAVLALAEAAHLAGDGPPRLVVLVVAESVDDLERVRRDAERRLAELGVEPRPGSVVVVGGKDQLAGAVRAERGGLLVLAAGAFGGDPGDLERLLNQVAMAVLVVRDSPRPAAEVRHAPP